MAARLGRGALIRYLLVLSLLWMAYKVILYLRLSLWVRSPSCRSLCLFFPSFLFIWSKDFRLLYGRERCWFIFLLLRQLGLVRDAGTRTELVHSGTSFFDICFCRQAGVVLSCLRGSYLLFESQGGPVSEPHRPRWVSSWPCPRS
jgi:hypothetical protein